MKYPCSIIIDLLPLYHDGVCSGESAEAIQGHLDECESCRVYYQTLQASDQLVKEQKKNDEEMQKAASLRAVKRKLLQKRMLTGVLSMAILFILALGAVTYMEKKTILVTYDNNIQVLFEDGDLIARLAEMPYTKARSILVTVEGNGKTENVLYFCFSTSLWNGIMARDAKSYSVYVLAYEEKGAGEIDRVYYFTGDHQGLESLSPDELIQKTQGAVLLWSKDRD